MPKAVFDARLKAELALRNKVLSQKNSQLPHDGAPFKRWKNAVLTREHVPTHWRFDLDPKANPWFLERLGVNAVFNSGALYEDGTYILAPRVEGTDRKSFFGIAESKHPAQGFRFRAKPVLFKELDDQETNHYDLRLVRHEDGWVYGTFCVEKKDPAAKKGDLSSATAECGIIRTRDFDHWERLPNLKTKSPQQRNVVLHPEFVSGQYGFYTRPQDGFIEAGSGGGICWGTCKDITRAVVESEQLVDGRAYHTIKEVKNGQGPAPIRTPKGWLHIAHGVRNTAAGLRYVIYAFLTDLKQPWKLIASPGGHLLAPRGSERVGDVSNVAFTNGAVLAKGQVHLYYAASDTRLHVATAELDEILDWVLNTPEDPLRSQLCAAQRAELCEKNLKRGPGKSIRSQISSKK